MRQAIEEGFIFNVLENYITYETYFQIGKKIVDDPLYAKAKAMLVTGSRLHAVRYYFEFQKYIKKMGYTDLGVLVAFSGVVKDKITGQLVEYTEANINKFPDTETSERFESGEYQLLLVAEKYQTGFDQPLPHTMYAYAKCLLRKLPKDVGERTPNLDS